MNPRKVILASQSKQRYKLFKTLNIDFKVKPAKIDEQNIQASSQVERAKKVASAKAQEVSNQKPRDIVVAADTYGIADERVLEKPTSKKEAKSMLKFLSARKFQALTGFCYLDPVENINYKVTKVVQVKFRKLSVEEIDHYVKTEPVLTWSAAFSPAYDTGMALIASISGSLTAFTHGLPIEELTKFLRKSRVYK
jgi:septum formation protein